MDFFLPETSCKKEFFLIRSLASSGASVEECFAIQQRDMGRVPNWEVEEF